MLNQTSAAASATRPYAAPLATGRRGVVLWCGAEDDDDGPQENSEINVVRVVNARQGGRKPGLVQIADELDKVPWERAGGLALGKQRGILSVKG
jgi:hypothetical protein